MTMSRYSVFDMRINNLDVDEVYDFVSSNKNNKDNFKFIVTPNVDHFSRYVKLNSTRKLYDNADICCLDSRVFRLLLRFRLNKWVKVCPGSDLTEKVLLSSISKNKITFVGEKCFLSI